MVIKDWQTTPEGVTFQSKTQAKIYADLHDTLTRQVRRSGTPIMRMPSIFALYSPSRQAPWV
jgi:hypothetical protein